MAINIGKVVVNDGGSSTHTSSSGTTHGGAGRNLSSGASLSNFLAKYGNVATNAYHQSKVAEANKKVYDSIASYGLNATNAYHQAKLKQQSAVNSVNNSYGGSVGNTTGTIPNDSTTRTSSVGVSDGGQFGNYLDMLRQIQSENNAFNVQQTEMVNAFNAQEAQKNRDWQQYMAENAHQIEVADLQKAGLNPVLSALNGNGATVGSGAVASGQKAVADDTTSRGIIGIINGLINAQTATAVANIYANASMYAANAGAGATRYSADQHSAAIRYSANASAVSNLVGTIARLFG